MQELMDAHPNLLTTKLNALATAQNANNGELGGDLTTHIADKVNPHEVTKTQVGTREMRTIPATG